MKNTSPLNRPSLLRLLVTMLYDFFLVVAVWFIVIALLMLIKFIIVGAPEQHERMLGGAWRMPTFFVMLLSALYFFGYFWVKNQQTLAMQTWRIQVVDEQTGGAINWQQATLRFFAACISLACFGLGYWWMLVDKEGKSWHDHLSGTRLVLLPKRQ